MIQKMKAGRLNPRDAKARLAREIVSIHHGLEKARQAEKEFDLVFKKKENPTDMPFFKAAEVEYLVTELIGQAGLASSKSEAKRLVEQGAVRIDDRRIESIEEKVKVKNGMIIRAGKRRFVKIKA